MAKNSNSKIPVILVAAMTLGMFTWSRLPKLTFITLPESQDSARHLDLERAQILYSAEKAIPSYPASLHLPSSSLSSLTPSKKATKTETSPTKASLTKVTTTKTARTSAAAATTRVRTKAKKTVPKTTAKSRQSKRVFQIYNHHPTIFQHFNFSECEYSSCELTADSLDADLVMVKSDKLKNNPLPLRRLGSLLLMYTKEPPTFKRFLHLNRSDLVGTVNWTRGVYSDSTFRAFYGKIIERGAPDKDYDAIFSGKRRPVAWFVSHCSTQSRREKYVARMSKEIQIDVFGRCGNLTCGKYGFEMGGQKETCTQMLSRDYKFYVSFENSLCSDYVTEKFFNMYEDVDVIPVVRGGATYSDIAPKNTYIDAKDFDSPEELGRYLVTLGNDRRRYTDMLGGKSRYTAVKAKRKFHCEVCEALHTRRSVGSVVPDLFRWLIHHCWNPRDL